MRIYHRVISLLFPERCPFCNAVIEAEDIACARCMATLKEKQQPIIRGAMGYRCISSFIYDGKVRKMLIGIKYYERVQHIRQAASILAKDIRSCYNDIPFDLITTVPMHPKDQRQRGYNQCELLSKELSKLLGVPFEHTLVKVKRTKKQHKLRYRERKTNLSGAFKLIDMERVRDKRILLIDDIVTSGCTLGACCKTLNKAKPLLLCCATIANADTPVDQKAVI